jgi:hypothetical protein
MTEFKFDENKFYDKLIAILEYEHSRLGDWGKVKAKIGVDRDTVLKWRKLKRFPSLRSLIKICEATNYPPAHLLSNK